MVLVYAVTDACAGTLDESGSRVASLRAVQADGLCALVADHDAPPEASEDSLWEHQKLIESLMDGRVLAPMRFGSAAPDDDAVRGLLRERRAELEAVLERVRGAVEMGVRVALAQPPDSTDSAGPGRAYLGSRLRLREAARELGRPIEAELGALARARRLRLVERPTPTLAGAFLVEHASMCPFRARAAALERDLGVELHVTGPWPPYSFVGQGGLA